MASHDSTQEDGGLRSAFGGAMNGIATDSPGPPGGRPVRSDPSVGRLYPQWPRRASAADLVLPWMGRCQCGGFDEQRTAARKVPVHGAQMARMRIVATFERWQVL